MTSVYILKLEKDKYYVGKSANVEKRIKDHFEGRGSVWTRLYKPISVAEIIEDCDDFDEDKYVKVYMSKYGINNVRGGSYSTATIEIEVRNVIEKEIASAHELCFNCGSDGHYVKDCKSLTKQHNRDVLKCHRCGRTGHVRESCYAKTRRDGSAIKMDHCYRCGKSDHFVMSCKETIDVDGKNIGNNQDCIII